MFWEGEEYQEISPETHKETLRYLKGKKTGF